MLYNNTTARFHRKEEKNNMNQLKERFRRFMVGRYGMDQLGQCLTYVVLGLILLNVFIRAGLPSRVIELLELAGIFILYFRMFSKNISKRYKENEAYMRATFHMTEGWKKWKFRWQESRKYHIFHCPSCKQKVRVPRGRGKISIHCPKCGADFIKKS